MTEGSLVSVAVFSGAVAFCVSLGAGVDVGVLHPERIRSVRRKAGAKRIEIMVLEKSY
jgi:hypothetical protein